MNKILCPVDFSEASINALEFAAAIAKKHQSKLTLVYVFTESDFNKIVGEEAYGKSFKELLALASTKLSSLTETIAKSLSSTSAHCDYRVELGELTDQLKSMVNDEHYDYILMGTTGVSRTNGIYFGSQTEEVIEKINVPVMCIPEGASFTGFTNLVYASDYAEEDKLAIQDVISFATFFDSRISVLHINQNDSDVAYLQFIEELKSFIQYSKISFVHKEFKGAVELGIEEYMSAEKADLLVLFKPHRNFVAGIFHKSLTKTLAYSIDKPLLVLKLEA
ncbi:MAG: universal stress protein [Bacteroidota bacterium]